MHILLQRRHTASLVQRSFGQCCVSEITALYSENHIKFVNKLSKHIAEVFSIKKVVCIYIYIYIYRYHCFDVLNGTGVSNSASFGLGTGFNVQNSTWEKHHDRENTSWIRTGYIRVLSFENKLWFNFRLHFDCYWDFEWTRWPEVALKYIRWSGKWNEFSLSIDQPCYGTTYVETTALLTIWLLHK
jgi:hypothetical protein